MKKIWDSALFKRIMSEKTEEAIEEMYEMLGEMECCGDEPDYTYKRSRKIIRKSCFETNSSSAHSLLITKNDTHVTTDELLSNGSDNDDRIYVDDNGEIWLFGIQRGYGRSPFEILSSFEDKLKYAMCEFLGYKHGDEDDYDSIYQEFIDITKELIPGFVDYDISTKDVDIYLDEDGNELKSKDLKYDHWDRESNSAVYVYTAKDGAKKVATLSDQVYEIPDIGVIDHQSSGILTNFLRYKGITLKEFLTNKKYVIVVDGDEYEEFKKMKNAGLINQDFIEEEYSTSYGDIIYQQWLKEQNDEGSNS